MEEGVEVFSLEDARFLIIESRESALEILFIFVLC